MELLTDDDFFGGSIEECRIFKETFGYKTGGPVAKNKIQSGNNTNTSVATSCEHAPLLTVKEVMLKGVPPNAHGSSKCKDSKHMKSSLNQGDFEKNYLENNFNPSVVQIDSDSTVLHPSSDSSNPPDTFRVLEYSLFSGPSSSNVSTAAAEPLTNISGANDRQSNMVSNPNDIGCKDSEIIKQVSSSTSQESIGSKTLLTNDGFNSKSSNRESQEDDVLLGDVSLNAARDQLLDAVSRLMGAKGWQIESMKRSCRDYNERCYRSNTGKRVREFPKLWRLLGRSLSVNDNPGAVEKNYICWRNLDHYCKDVSLTFARTDLTVNPNTTDSELARIWNILDPFVHLMFINRKLGALRKATSIQALRSIPLNAFVKNNGDITFNKSDTILKKRSKNKPKNKRKIQQPDSSLANDNGNQNENAGSQRISGFGGKLGEGPKPKKSKKAKSGCKITSYQGGKGKCKNDVQQGDAEAVIFEKVTGMEISLFRSSLYDVHAELIKDWGSQNGLTKRAKTVLDLPIDNLENHTTVETVLSRYTNNKDTLLDISGPEILQRSGVSLVEKEFPDSSNVAPSEDPSIKYKMLYGSMAEPENNVDSFHNVVIIWNEQEDLTRDKKTFAEVDVVTVCLDSNHTGAVHKGRSFGPVKQINELIADDDMLLSAIKKKTKKRGRPHKGGSAAELKVHNVKKKVKGRGRGHKLHPRTGGKGENQVENENCIASGSRTPLSWLIDCEVVNLNDMILYLEPQSNDVLKKGFLTKDGILCHCCHEVYSVSKFSLHAGAKSTEACSNLFMECGKSYSSFQLIGWSTEYLKRKNKKNPTLMEDEDDSDDICGLCGEGGDLVCCDNCPATFHQKCLSVQEIPTGDWYCLSCVCHICGEFSRAGSAKRLKCSQCEHNYHDACLMDMDTIHPVTDDWFCSKLCLKVHSELQSRVGMVVPVANGYSSTILKCLHDDEKAYSETPIAMRAECNTKLAVALTIMEECFLSMVDFRTGIDMIPHMVYNFGSNFPRLDFHGFYTVILEKDDAVVCVATLRIHGSSIAEIPLVATCSKYRRQGMCRLLMGAIEEMLIALKINTIVMSAVPELVPTWTNGFGFQPVKEEEKSSLKTLNQVVFPGTVSLQKSLLQADPIKEIAENKNLADTIPIPKPVIGTNLLQLSEWHLMSSEPDIIRH